MGLHCPLELTPAQLRVLERLGDTLQWAKEARRDAVRAMTTSNARYFILGATGLDCDSTEEIERVLLRVWDGRTTGLEIVI